MKILIYTLLALYIGFTGFLYLRIQAQNKALDASVAKLVQEADTAIKLLHECQGKCTKG